VRRGNPPSQGQWSLPGGAQELGETAEAAARRELLEETGVLAGPLSLVANVDSIHPDPDGRIRFHYTILDFAGTWLSGEPRPGSDVTEAAFFPPDALDGLNLWSEAIRVIDLARRVVA
jgi:ADP-ribose pyrophosphatase YjhB (NUDIX family)